MGLPNTPLHNTKIHVLSGNLVTARPFGVVDGVDHLFTGRVRRIHGERIHQMLNERCIVLLSPLGYSPSGEAFNLSSEELAADVAIELGADKLIVFDTVSAVVDADGKPRSDLSPNELDTLLATVTFGPGTRSASGGTVARVPRRRSARPSDRLSRRRRAAARTVHGDRLAARRSAKTVFNTFAARPRKTSPASSN